MIRQLTCASCGHTVEYSAEQPRFCSFCGAALTGSQPRPLATATRTFTPDPDATPGAWETPTEIGGYRLLQRLGEGGMGVVWEAEQVETGRRVAVKLLSPSLPRSEQALERFLQEGRMAAALEHPRTTFVFAAGEEHGQPYIAMERMPGRTLADVVREEGQLPVTQAVDHILDVIEGLQAAHAIGVIHRDVKPSNCFLDGEDRVKIGDFGIAKSLVDTAGLTRTGSFVGTPLFAAPEQVKGATVDERSDVYSVAATLYYLISGHPVFEGDSAAVIARIVEDAPAPVSRHRPETPRELDSILARALEKNPGRRYRNLEQLRRALLPHASGGMTSASIWLRLAAYMIDTSAVMLLLVVAQVVAVMLNTLTGGTKPTAGQTMQDQHARSILVIGLYVLYFTIAEGQLGRGVGKALFGLRVVRLDGERAGLGRALLRACILPGGLGLPALAAVALLLRQTGPGVSQPLTVSVQDQVLSAVINSSVPLLALLCMLTIRARNGYRGLHELASGTRVVYTPRPRLVQALAVPVPPVQPSERQGEVFGPYRVEGRLGRMAGAELLVARDRQLHRSVWVRVHDGVEAPAVERRNLARATRVRWLQGGVVDGSRWDA